MSAVLEYPGTAIGVGLAVLVLVYSVLTSTNVAAGIVVAGVLVGIGAVADWMPISAPAPRQLRATLLVMPTVVLSGVYAALTTTNVLLWILAAVVVIGVGLLLDSLLRSGGAAN